MHRNRYGDSGHPCLIPVICSQFSEVSPFISTLYDLQEYSLLITFISCSSNLSLSSARKSASFLTLSKAFPQSNVINLSVGHSFGLFLFALLYSPSNQVDCIRRAFVFPETILGLLKYMIHRSGHSLLNY